MMNKWLNRGMAIVGALGILIAASNAAYIEHEGVQNTRANPAPGAGESNINTYTFQDEQINLLPDDGLVKVLRTSQKNLVNDFIPVIIPIKHAFPREIRNVMRRVTAAEGGRAEVIRDKETNENALALYAPKYMVPYLEDAVRVLDVPWLEEYLDGAFDAYIDVQHRNGGDVNAIASQYGGTGGFSTFDQTNNGLRRFDEEYRITKYAQAVEMVDIPCNQVSLEVKVYQVNALNDLKLGLDYINWSNGPGRNLWSFAEAGYSAEQRAWGRSSVFDPFLDARTFIHPALTSKDLVSDVAAVTSSRAVNYLLTSNFVDFLQVKGSARVLTSTNVTLCSGATAAIEAENQVLAFVNNDNNLDSVQPDRGPTFVRRNNNGLILGHGRDSVGRPSPIDVPTPGPELDGTAESGGGTNSFLDFNNNGIRDFQDLNGDGRKQNNEPFIEPLLGGAPAGFDVQDGNRRLHYQSAGEVGINVELTPYVGLESMELDVDIELGEQGQLAPSGVPIINFRTVSTTVRLMDGQPFVIASLKQSEDVKNTAKAPFLGDIPGLGYIFGGETDTKRQDDLVITITPTFQLSDQVRLAKPPRIDTLDCIIRGDLPQGAPPIEYGFDQWLLDS